MSELATFIDKVLSDQKKTLNSVRIQTIVLGLVTVIVAGYFLFLSSRLSTFTHDTVATGIRYSIENALPTASEAIRKDALDSAPQVAKQAERYLLTLPVEVRKFIEKKMEESVGGLSYVVEGAVNDILSVKFDAAMAEIEKHAQGITTEHKIEAVLAAVRKDFRLQTDQLVSEFYDTYGGSVKNLKTNLVALKNGKNLTATEKIFKEIIQVWAAITKDFTAI